MNTRRLSNIPLNDFRKFLEKAGCTSEGIKGGHEKWVRRGLLRPVILQTHIDPVPEFIVKNTLRNLGLTKEDYFRIIRE
ncbi:MAG: type II toxin-antitoxin system HicA family toxin [Bacteroides sp.]|nr:type II toxin-antitoxin system HicA family toxin [Bacteroides sp.]